MKNIFMVQLGIYSMPVSIEEDNEVQLFKIKLQDKIVFLEKGIIGNSAIWTVKSHSEDVNLVKFKKMLPAIKDQINQYLVRRLKYL